MGHGMELPRSQFVYIFIDRSGYFCRSSGDRPFIVYVGILLRCSLTSGRLWFRDPTIEKRKEAGSVALSMRFCDFGARFSNADSCSYCWKTDFFNRLCYCSLIVLLVFYAEFLLREWLDRMLLA
jgi:hypothetical protein